MIVFGKKSKVIFSEATALKCASCWANQVTLHVEQKYGHIFWIPAFPMGRGGFSECAHCKQALRLKEMPPDYQTEFKRIKTTKGFQAWTFSAVFVIAAVIAIGSYFQKQRDAANAPLIAAPLAGDIYEIKMGYRSYTLYKVHHVSNDTVYVQLNQYEVSKSRKLDELLKKPFLEEAEPMLKSELKDLFENGKILDVHR